MVAAIEKGFPQMEISDAAYKYQRQIDSGEKVMIGINKYNSDDKVSIPFVEIDDTVETQQIARLSEVRRKRDNKRVRECLDDIKNACRKGENVMPYCIEAVKAYASVQEICDCYREVYGEYRDPGLD
jgi:methylmalonyl-CoA mutase N-terminal domain/subunit